MGNLWAITQKIKLVCSLSTTSRGHNLCQGYMQGVKPSHKCNDEEERMIGLHLRTYQSTVLANEPSFVFIYFVNCDRKALPESETSAVFFSFVLTSRWKCEGGEER